MDRCTGHCCRRIVINDSPEQLDRRKRKIEDGRTLAEMLVPVEPVKGGYLYRCKYHRDNGDCGIYPVRPAMCSKYPYGQICTRKGCTHPECGLPPNAYHVWYWLYETSIEAHCRYWFTW